MTCYLFLLSKELYTWQTHKPSWYIFHLKFIGLSKIDLHSGKYAILIYQRILVSSALRRPHATHFSPLDYQSMPDVGKSPRQPYKSNSACTVFTYANRPLYATESPKHLGKHTKSRYVKYSCKMNKLRYGREPFCIVGIYLEIFYMITVCFTVIIMSQAA